MNPTDPAAPLLAFAFLAVAGTAIAFVWLTLKALWPRGHKGAR